MKKTDGKYGFVEPERINAMLPYIIDIMNGDRHFHGIDGENDTDDDIKPSGDGDTFIPGDNNG